MAEVYATDYIRGITTKIWFLDEIPDSVITSHKCETIYDELLDLCDEYGEGDRMVDASTSTEVPPYIDTTTPDEALIGIQIGDTLCIPNTKKDTMFTFYDVYRVDSK